MVARGVDNQQCITSRVALWLPALMHTQPCARNLPAACLSLISSQGDDDNADDDDLDDVDDQGHGLNEQIK